MMGALNNKVTNINKINCKEIIESFLSQSSRSGSKHTQNNYRIDIKDFFKRVKRKEIKFLKEEDLSMNINDIDNFIISLKKDDKSNNTINRRLSSLKMFYDYLEGRKEIFKLNANIEKEVFNKINKPKGEENYHGDLDIDEVEEMADLVLTTEKKSPQLKRMLILFALASGLRKSELQSLRWEDFIMMRDGRYLLEVEGKGKKNHKRYINSKLYSEMWDVREDEDIVFPFDNNEIQYMMNRLIKKMNISPKRKIVFHSIRGCSITQHYLINKDPVLTQDFAGHESFDTTRRYIKANNDGFDDILSVREALNSNDLESLTKEQLLEIINNKNDLKIQLLSALNKLK